MWGNFSLSKRFYLKSFDHLFEWSIGKKQIRTTDSTAEVERSGVKIVWLNWFLFRLMKLYLSYDLCIFFLR